MTRAALGQFMTPPRIARFMAELFGNRQAPATLMDAGAGTGALSVAASRVLALASVQAWEIDPVLQNCLSVQLDALSVPYALHRKDFITDSVQRLLDGDAPRFTHAILNPPYKKIGAASEHRRACRRVGIETVNLYTAFWALAILQMRPGGQIVAIIPRSWCNGPYYKPFRQLLLEHCAIDHIHVFESRSHAFKDDAVLQENVIVKLTRAAPQGPVTLSFSRDAGFGDLRRSTVDFARIVRCADTQRFIHVPAEADSPAQEDLFACSLAELGLQVCTGPVVDFRVKPHWSQEPCPGSVPLLYPHHLSAAGLRYPVLHKKKPNALMLSAQVCKWLMPRGCYVLVKRFSAKEERRRVVAYVLAPEELACELVGFENHWNVFHVDRRGLDETIARGLACFLNSTVLDRHFRMFSGHTQVNATDLRNIRYPALGALCRLGAQYRNAMSQHDIDALISSQAGCPADPPAGA